MTTKEGKALKREAGGYANAKQFERLKRRQPIEPAIGHVKHDNRMIRCYLRGSIGDALYAISCAAGYNIRWLMRAIMRLGLRGLFALVFFGVLAHRFAAIRSTKTAYRRRYAIIPHPFILYCGLT